MLVHFTKFFETFYMIHFKVLNIWKWPFPSMVGPEFLSENIIFSMQPSLLTSYSLQMDLTTVYKILEQ